MFRILILLAFSFALTNVFADCQDVCTDGEAVCVEVCSNTGFATLGCVTKCSKTARTCANKCTPEPKPQPEPKPEEKGSSLSNLSGWRSAFPFNKETGGLITSGCCEPGNPMAPMCAYALCKEPDFDRMTNRNWSGKLFDSDSGLLPKNIYSICSKNPTPVCSILKTPLSEIASKEPSMNDLKMFRKHLEAFRRSTDYARATNQMSADEQKQFLDAYKRDYRSVLSK